MEGGGPFRDAFRPRRAGMAKQALIGIVESFASTGTAP